MDQSTVTTLILGTFGIILTGYYSWHTQKLANEKMQKDLFTEFNKRYDALNEPLTQIEQNYSTLELLNQAKNPEKLKQKINDYFILCSEEFYWYHHKKRIDPIIWKSWQAGMSYWYNKVPTVKALWKQEILNNGKDSYYITDNTEFFIENTPNEQG